MKIVFRILLVVDALALIGFVALSQFGTAYNTATGVLSDGLGRALLDTPAFLRFLGIERYVGMGWLLFDVVVILGLLALGAIFFAFSCNKK